MLALPAIPWYAWLVIAAIVGGVGVWWWVRRAREAEREAIRAAGLRAAMDAEQAARQAEAVIREASGRAAGRKGPVDRREWRL